MYGGQAMSASMCEAVGHALCCNCLTAWQLSKDSVLCQCDAVCALSWAGCRFVVWQLLWRSSLCQQCCWEMYTVGCQVSVVALSQAELLRCDRVGTAAAPSHTSWHWPSLLLAAAYW